MRKRPCRICRQWFMPHPRAGDRQRVCSSPDCQKERHRRADHSWHRRNPSYDKKRRLREAVKNTSEESDPESPLDELDWDVVERAIGPKPRVIAEEISRLLIRHAQDAVTSKTMEISREPHQQLNRCSQDAVAQKNSDEPVVASRVLSGQRKTQCEKLGRDP